MSGITSELYAGNVYNITPGDQDWAGQEFEFIAMALHSCQVSVRHVRRGGLGWGN